MASGTKGLTALAVASLIDEGLLDFDAKARTFLRTDLPLIDEDVTIRQLLAHRSGIGDYFAEASNHPITDYVLPIAVNRLLNTEDFLLVLGGFPQSHRPGEKFEYCNSWFVVLALIAERIAGAPFSDLVSERVCKPAGMSATEFLRSDALPGDAAIGYFSSNANDLQSNVFNLPLRGTGDGGIYSTAADFAAFWPALFAGQIAPEPLAEDLVRPQSSLASPPLEYGLGFWRRPADGVVMLEGYDAGVSFRSWHQRETAPDRHGTFEYFGGSIAGSEGHRRT
ncbi:serine hydrolase domain-containing protein [Renibacterium salmoninarum]|uniref:serine hydrolase domain-containing protein n=1 Tax=Renibacterium salmoninarum TaxID=1646 RepID=UPI002277C3E6|nr:serine hydrolase domain-containing protein [Renibacterium salmoninarum]